MPQINTTYVAIPISNTLPCMQPKAIRLVIEATEAADDPETFVIDLTQAVERGIITGTQTLFIDTSEANGETIFISQHTDQRLVLGGGKQAYLPFLISPMPVFEVVCNGNGFVRVQILNVDIAPAVYDVAGGGGGGDYQQGFDDGFSAGYDAGFIAGEETCNPPDPPSEAFTSGESFAFQYGGFQNGQLWGWNDADNALPQDFQLRYNEYRNTIADPTLTLPPALSNDPDFLVGFEASLIEQFEQGYDTGYFAPPVDFQQTAFVFAISVPASRNGYVLGVADFQNAEPQDAAAALLANPAPALPSPAFDPAIPLRDDPGFQAAYETDYATFFTGGYDQGYEDAAA